MPYSEYRPELMGSATLEPSGAIEAGSWQTFELVYTSPEDGKRRPLDLGQYPAVSLDGGAGDPELASAFVELLTSHEAGDVLDREGFR